MGLLDNLKNVLGGKKDNSIASGTRAPSQVLQEGGVDPSQLKFMFASDGTVTVSGQAAKEGDQARIKQLLLGIPGIKKVVLELSVATADTSPAPAAAEAAAPSSAPDAPASADAPAEPEAVAPAATDTYTVQAGDTLWKIAKQYYGEGNRYLEIFEANKDLLKDPDHIFPGQELTIPQKSD